MNDLDQESRWRRLLLLLDPIHEKAIGTARSLCRNTADGDDLYQEAVLRAFRKLPGLRDEARFRSWFFTVLLSVHRSRCRRPFWKRFLPLETVAPDDEGLIGEDGLAREEEARSARRAARALSRLASEQREALVLFELEGFSMEEIAAMQETSVASVKSRVQRARARLRRHYQAQGLGTSRTGSVASRLAVSATKGLEPAYSSATVHARKRGDHE